VRVNVKYFGPVYVATGVREEQIALPEKTTIEELLVLLDKRYDKLHSYLFDQKGDLIDYLSISVNGVYITNMKKFDTLLKDGDLIFLMPPIGGG
jgi:MoaD family protein